MQDNVNVIFTHSRFHSFEILFEMCSITLLLSVHSTSVAKYKSSSIRGIKCLSNNAYTHSIFLELLTIPFLPFIFPFFLLSTIEYFSWIVECGILFPSDLFKSCCLHSREWKCFYLKRHSHSVDTFLCYTSLSFFSCERTKRTETGCLLNRPDRIKVVNKKRKQTI